MDKEKIKKDYEKENKKDLISDYELDKIYNFFKKNEDFQSLLKDKKNAYQKYKIYFIIYIIFLIILNFIFIINLGGINLYNVFSILIILISFYLFYLKFDFKSNFLSKNKNIEENIFSNFVASIFDGAKFSLSDKYFDETVKEIKDKTGLLSYYDKIDKFANSLSYEYFDGDTKIADISGIEIYTMKKYKDKDGNTKRRKADHVYVQKIELIGENSDIFDRIKITNKFSFETKEIGLLLIILIFSVFILYNFIQTKINYWVIVLSFTFFVIIFLFFWTSKKGKKVELEDIDFTKKFNIRAEDQIKVRNFLDSRTINSIKDLVSKFPNKKFNFFFEKNQIYVIIHLNNNFFSLGNYLFLHSTYKCYVDFYILTREIFNIPKVLNIDYYI
ncbi:DUF3137 domain-containing protein [Candidatus Vampirococcus lugosii]|uniref:DUF3137 domain-containing protein n=1 Tax=Candidatus Vampirococcus lugosii TaxID=2789015 RepID=A0ABS5QPB3_9BACT|nr:DUF3137 domain-containing protein [Candidatus Vampirococcus lugosii]MBS8122487.1 hypothetical protein [Candidatus Vampirococcus lugosii]